MSQINARGTTTTAHAKEDSMVNKIVQSSQYGYANTLGIMLLVFGIAAMLLCNKLFGMNRAD